MPDLQTNLNPAASPAPAATPQPAPQPAMEQATSTGDSNTNVQEFIEVDGRRPATAPSTESAKTEGKYKDLSEANKGYDELYKLYTQATGRTVNTVEKLEKAFAELPNTLGQIIAQNLAALQQKTSEPAKPAETKPAQPNSLFKFSIDDITDPENLAATLSNQLSPLLNNMPKIDENKLIEGMASKFDAIVEQRIAAREQAALKSRAEADIKELVDAGNDPALVEAAVIYGIKNQKNSVDEAWRFFQQKFPQMFAEKKAENIIGELAGSRQQVPRELGSSVAVDADGLRSAFSGVRNFKFASNELL